MSAADIHSMPSEANADRGRSAPATILASLFVAQAMVLASAWWFAAIANQLIDLPYGAKLEQVYAALVTTWSDGSYDTTYGYRSFGPQAMLFSMAFAVSAIGLWRQRAWGHSLATLLAALGALEPILRLAAIEYLMPYSDSLGYLVDLAQARVALIAVSLPSTAILMLLLFANHRHTPGTPTLSYRQFTLTHMVTATTLIAILLKHFLSLSQVYGMV